MDGVCSLYSVGVRLGVRVSSAACNFRRAITKVPAERVWCGSARCGCGEADWSSDGACGWSCGECYCQLCDIAYDRCRPTGELAVGICYVHLHCKRAA